MLAFLLLEVSLQPPLATSVASLRADTRPQNLALASPSLPTSSVGGQASRKTQIRRPLKPTLPCFSGGVKIPLGCPLTRADVRINGKTDGERGSARFPTHMGPSAD